VRGGIDTQRDGDQVDDHNRYHIELDGDWQAFGDFAPYWLIVFEGLAKFQGGQIAQPTPVLHWQ